MTFLTHFTLNNINPEHLNLGDIYEHLDISAAASSYVRTLTSQLLNAASNGYTDNFVVSDDQLLVCLRTSRTYIPEEVIIGNQYLLQNDAVLYMLETEDGTKGTLADGFGTYSDEHVRIFVGAIKSIRQ